MTLYVAKITIYVHGQDHFLCGYDPFKILKHIIIKEHNNRFHIWKTAAYADWAKSVFQQVKVEYFDFLFLMMSNSQ